MVGARHASAGASEQKFGSDAVRHLYGVLGTRIHVDKRTDYAVVIQEALDEAGQRAPFYLTVRPPVTSHLPFLSVHCMT